MFLQGSYHCGQCKPGYTGDQTRGCQAERSCRNRALNPCSIHARCIEERRGEVTCIVSSLIHAFLQWNPTIFRLEMRTALWSLYTVGCFINCGTLAKTSCDYWLAIVLFLPHVCKTAILMYHIHCACVIRSLGITCGLSVVPSEMTVRCHLEKTSQGQIPLLVLSYMAVSKDPLCIANVSVFAGW